MRRFGGAAVWGLMVGWMCSASLAGAQNSDILLLSPRGGTNGHGLIDGDGALYRVDAITGNRTLVSDFGNGLQGPLGDQPKIIMVETSGQVLVADSRDSGTATTGQPAGVYPVLFRVNPTNGQRAIVSDFGDASQGPTALDFVGLAAGVIEASGNILVVTGARELFRVNPISGQRTLLNVGDTGPYQLVKNTDGTVFSIDSGIRVASTCATGDTGRGRILRLDPVDGTPTLVSDLSDPAQGPTGCNPQRMVVAPSGDVALVLDAGWFATNYLAMLRVDLNTGMRTAVAFDVAGLPPVIIYPPGAAIEPDGTVVMTIRDNPGSANVSRLLRIDPVSRQVTTLSTFADGEQGPWSGVPGDLALLDGAPAALAQSYQCRSAAPDKASGAPPFTRTTMTLADAFGSREATMVRPAQVCLPVDADGAGIDDPSANLTCFKTKDAVPAPVAVSHRVQMSNALGQQTLKVGKAKLFCVRSTRTDLP